MSSTPSPLFESSMYSTVQSPLTLGDRASIWALMIFTLCITCIIQVMMIVIGATNPNISCESPCSSTECTFARNAPFVLGTPAIGISASVWLIVGGILGIFFVIIVPLGLRCCQSEHLKIKCDVKFIMTVVVFLVSIVWLSVGIVVYKQTKLLCTEAKGNLWSIDSPAMNWLFGTMIGGWVFLCGPFVLYLLCSCSSGITDNDIRRARVIVVSIV